MILYHNSERFDTQAYGENKIVRESVITQTQLDPNRPSWLPYRVEQQELNDESALLQYGQSDLSTFFQLETNSPLPSSENDDLIEKPNGYYKMGSVEIIVKPTLQIIDRQTYGIFDWLGDVGGLNDGLYIIMQVALFPFTQFY